MRLDQDWYTRQEQPDPNDRRERRPPLPRLWPYVLAGVVTAILLWAYLEPVPEHTPVEPVSLGPDSPLYGPVK